MCTTCYCMLNLWLAALVREQVIAATNTICYCNYSSSVFKLTMLSSVAVLFPGGEKATVSVSMAIYKRVCICRRDNRWRVKFISTALNHSYSLKASQAPHYICGACGAIYTRFLVFYYFQQSLSLCNWYQNWQVYNSSVFKQARG